MGPERFAGEPPIPQSDLFGLMVTFFELLSGRPLLGKMKYFNIFATFLSEKYLETVKRQGLPKVLEKILLKGLAFKPEDRFQSAETLAKELREVQGTLGLTANRDKLLAELQDLSKIS